MWWCISCFRNLFKIYWWLVSNFKYIIYHLIIQCHIICHLQNTLGGKMLFAAKREKFPPPSTNCSFYQKERKNNYSDEWEEKNSSFVECYHSWKRISWFDIWEMEGNRCKERIHQQILDGGTREIFPYIITTMTLDLSCRGGGLHH